MNITQENFEELLPRIVEDIKQCDFISIDAEFTGLGLDPLTRNDILDTSAERYEKVSKVITQYLPIQIGICTFTYKKDAKQYIANPYNFYIFPKTGNRFFGLDRAFKCQVSSLEFLNQHQFDFSKWISTGIPFVSLDEEERIQKKLQSIVDDSPMNEGDTLHDFAQGCIVQVKDFLQNSTEKEMIIKTPSNYHKRVVHQTIKREYVDLIRFNGFVGCQSQRTHVQLTKLTEEEKQKQIDSSRQNVLQQELTSLIGFRKVIDAISASSKPLVGHNVFLDMCYIYHNFCRTLPPTVEEFKTAVHNSFPFIYDTKYLAQNLPKLQVRNIDIVCRPEHCVGRSV
jgi:poly(A)-specific ribonuclease